MPRSEQANQRIREAQREKILEAARKVFAQKGRTATMADIATEAKVSQGLAYRYFASKDEIFQLLVEQMLQASESRMPHILEMPMTPGERLNFIVAGMVDSRREKPEFFQLLYQLLTDETLPNTLRELLQAQAKQTMQVLRQLIVEGQATGEVAQDDPDQLLATLMACVQGLWQGMAYVEPEEVRKNFPSSKIVMRLLKPDTNQPQASVKSGD